MSDQERAQRMQFLNIQRCAEAMELLYQTYIVGETVAADRGHAIQAINRMILGLGGADTIAKFEAAPWSARMRESGEPDLVKLAEEVADDIAKRPSSSHCEGFLPGKDPETCGHCGVKIAQHAPSSTATMTMWDEEDEAEFARRNGIKRPSPKEKHGEAEKWQSGMNALKRRISDFLVTNPRDIHDWREEMHVLCTLVGAYAGALPSATTASDALRELLWVWESKTVKGAFQFAAIHGMGPSEETPRIIKAVEQAKAALSSGSDSKGQG